MGYAEPEARGAGAFDKIAASNNRVTHKSILTLRRARRQDGFTKPSSHGRSLSGPPVMATPNPKSEARNPKQIRNSKFKGSKHASHAGFEHFPLDFEFVSDFEFGTSTWLVAPARCARGTNPRANASNYEENERGSDKSCPLPRGEGEFSPASRRIRLTLLGV